MSNYGSNQPHYPYNNPYTISNAGGQQHGLNHRSSFDNGDDTAMFGGNNAQQQSQYHGYGQSPQAQAPQSGYTQSGSLPYRTASQSQLGGYQHQSQPAAPAHASYNPAQYQPQNSYNPQSYGSPQANTYTIGGGGYNSSYQPYVPAAYGDQGVNRSASLYNSHYATSPPTSYGSAPPPPPRPHLNQASAASFPSDASHGYTYQSNQYLGMPSPPAPAPPPHQESLGPARAYSHSGTSYDHHSQFSSQSSSDINRQHSDASRISNQYSSSPQPSSGGLPSRTPSQGNNYGRHPQGSTLPGLPSESESDGERYLSNNPAGVSDLMHDINAALGSSSTHAGYNIESQRDSLFSPASPQLALSPDERPTHDGIISTGDTHINYGAFANDSDAEAAAGLAAMAAADEQEAAENARRRSSHLSSNPQFSDRERSDESDYAGYGDLSLAGGGYAGTMHYGGDLPAVRTSTHFTNDQQNRRMNSTRSSGMSSDSQGNAGYDAQPFPRLHADIARVDAGGTGGLTEPSTHGRRLSYDEGDEGALSDVGESGDGIPDLFFHPGMSPNRPLPPPPARSGSDAGSRATQHLSASHALHANRHSTYESVPRYPGTPDAFNHDTLNPPIVPRSTSLLSNRSQPRAEQPTRSKTDADRARILKQQEAARAHGDGFDIGTPRSDVDVGTLDLPAIPRKRFDPSKIPSESFKKCTEPWAMSSVFNWLRSLTDEETELKETAVTEAIAALFTHKVPTMSSIDGERLAQHFVRAMYSSKVLQKDEEWVKFAPGQPQMSGVLYQLTGLGCYSSRLHLDESAKGKCYSHLCMRTVRKADFDIPESLQPLQWHEYWKLDKERMDSRGNKEKERQLNLREVINSEQIYLYGLKLMRTLYVDQLGATDIIPEKRRAAFINNTFGGAEACRTVNEEFLAPQLKYRENEQGPFVVGYSDIMAEWIRRARPIYVEYAAKYPKADLLVREELKRNPAFATFVDDARRNPASARLAWDHYISSPLTKIQRLILQLETIAKNSVEQNKEKTDLQLAIDEIKVTAHEMDARVNEVNKAVELLAYQTKLRFRRNQGDEVDLALDQLGRTIVLKSDLMRQGTKGVNWVNCHAILFDHYLVLAKPQRDITGDGYDVSKPPIPMGLISLESTNDPAVQRSAVRGVVTAAPGQMGPRGIDPRLARTTSSQSGSLSHTTTGLTQGSGGSGSGIGVPSNIDNDSNETKIYYPFKVKHLGRPEVYTLYAPSADRRNEWCEAIISTKTQHAEALYAQNAEPFKLRVLADTAFGLESYGYAGKRISIRGTPLDRAIREVERKYTGTGRPAPISRAAVNCATVFQQSGGRVMCAVGTDAGVYFSEYTNPRGWVRVSCTTIDRSQPNYSQAIQMNKVTQISVLEEFNLLILLSDKVLIAYHLDVVCPANGPPVPQTDSSVKKAPQRLSGKTDVGFFLTGKMKDRLLVFYQKKDGINSIFKILEPVLQKSATSKSKWLGGSSRRGQTEFFREYDEFYIPAETYGLNAFHSSLAVATKRGMEVLTLDKKITWGVPNLDSPEEETRVRLSTIAARLKDLRPLGMFRLSEAEFLVAFSECAVYVNKLGDISRSVIMEFVGKANTACLYYPYLILFNDDFVEIRDAQNGRMKQVIAGQNIKMLDDGGNQIPGQQQAASLGGGTNGLGVQGFHSAPKTVKLSMQHPEQEKSYVVVEMLMRTEQQ